MTTRLTSDQVNSWRLTRHHLAVRAGKRHMAQVVSKLCGIQAQVLSAAELAIRARVDGVVHEDVQAALWKDHSVVKTWCMRGTLHLLAASDLPLYVAALDTKLAESKEWLQRSEGVSPAEVDAITAEIARVLAKKNLSREDLSREVESHVTLGPKARKALRSAWGILLRPAAYKGKLVFGESDGPRATFTAPTHGPVKEPSTREAFTELFHRFLRSYGPATMRDFGYWWGNLGDGEKTHLKSIRDDLSEVGFEGFRGLMLRSDAEEATSMSRVHGVHLLPSFDCYPMFYAPRELVVSEAYRSRVFRKTAGWNYPALVIDGTIAGIWNLDRSGRRAVIRLEAFRSLGSVEKKGLQEEAADIGRFLDAPAEVKFLSLGDA